MGYVTSGNYSLSRGRGHGVGAVSLAAVVGHISCLKGYNIFFKLSGASTDCFAYRPKLECLVKVKNRDGTICRVARLDFGLI